jgi:predicted Ser/Thr protein kinase
MRGIVAWLIAALALLPTACANDPVLEIHQPRLRSNGVEQVVILPGNFANRLSPGAGDTALVMEVDLPSSFTGDVSLVTPPTLGVRELRVDGVPVQPLDGPFRPYVMIGRAFAIPRAATERRHLRIEAFIVDDVVAAGRLVGAPKLSATPRGDRVHRLTRSFNELSSYTAVVTVLTLGLVHGIVFLLDRRRRVYAWYAAFAFTGAPFNATTTGGLHDLLGRQFVLAALAVGALSAICYVRFLFEYFGARSPTWFRWSPLALAVPWVVSRDAANSVWSQQYVLAIGAGCMVLGFIHGLGAARRGTRSSVALTTMIGVFSVLIVPEVFFGAFISDPLGGVRTLSLGFCIVALGNSILLARDHRDLGLDLEQRVRELDVSNTELRRQVGERSRELSEALAKLGGMPTHSTKLHEGDVVDGRYRVLRALGAGGMGAVYEVERTTDGKHLAMKILLEAKSGAALARFAREAQIAAEIQHQNIAGVIDVGIADSGVMFVVMELIAGGSLEDARTKFGDRTWAAPLLGQIAAGLSALHVAGVIHRDLKPANILLGTDGRARISDFGIAALQDNIDVLAETRAANDKLTQAGSLLGTPIYMAPELARGAENASTKSDVFAFGILAYEMLSSSAPFATPPVLDALVGRATPTPRAIGEDPLEKAVLRAISLDPAQRPSMEEFRELTARSA